MPNKYRKDSLNEKLDLILSNQKKILLNEKKILSDEEKIENYEEKELDLDNEELKDESSVLKELEGIEKNILSSKKSSPIKSITKRDFIKGFIGSFIGVISHFAFEKAAVLAQNISLARASFLYLLSILIIVVMLYYTGFREVKKTLVFQFLPLRVLVLFFVSIFTIIFVNWIFGEITFPISLVSLYILVGTNILLAVIGAVTADLIGKE